MQNQPHRLARYLSHDMIKQTSRSASSQTVPTDDSFSILLKRLAEVEPAKLPGDNDN
ncbi:hypothetical protein [Rhizobium sp. Leaf262]|uniref:hypothetical protein n=1 Tax=Rhizobium sp. Leaf262 TaxID=1736312 RepID=UPI000A55F7F5|nr:hypothetical protein [Rhizobium sp. Leaf262]